MLSAAIKRLYHSVFPSLRRCLPVFVERQRILYFYCPSNTTIANSPLGGSAVIVPSIINQAHCSCIGIRQIRLKIWPEPDLAGFPKNGWFQIFWVEIWHNPSKGVRNAAFHMMINWLVQCQKQSQYNGYFRNTKVLHQSVTPNLKSNCWTLV